MMEELKKLEQVQKVLSLMQHHSVGHVNSPQSDRFVASLILLLVQPCGLDLEEKCQLVYDTMPKLSRNFLQKVSDSLLGEDQDESCVPLSDCDHDVMGDPGAVKMNIQNEPVVGLDAMQRANSTLEDFCRSYFMFHDLDANKPQSLFRYLPILSFTESYIYQLDYMNEQILYESVGSHTVPKKEPVLTQMTDDNMRAFINPFRKLVLLFQRHGLFMERIKTELNGGEEYWKLERNLCSALINKEEISIEDVMRAIFLKSFDYRVLNLLLFKLRGESVNDIFMDFLSASEFLVEVADDLFDYEDDVLENNFNILRMFVRIYGPSAAPSMLAKCISEGEDKYNQLLKGLDPELARKYNLRCQEATEEGRMGSGPPLGTWNVPAIILDEDLYRSSISANMN